MPSKNRHGMPGEKGLPAGETPRVNGQRMSSPGCASRMLCHSSCGKARVGGVGAVPAVGQFDVGAAQRTMKPLGEHGFVAGHDELAVRRRVRAVPAHGQGVAGAGQAMSGTAAHMVRL